MHISHFDYELPEELIAQEPLERREAARMLVVDRKAGTWTDSEFASLPQYIQPADVLVVNNTKVFPARLIGERHPRRGRVEVLLLRQLRSSVWEALIRPGRRLKEGAKLIFGNGRLIGEVLSGPGATLRQVRFRYEEEFRTLLMELGNTPLPPYIKRSADTSTNDRQRYQTVFARNEGAVAAPTAGLHFTIEIMQEISSRGANIAEITLHVGYGTFEPIRAEDLGKHRVSPELCQISLEAAKRINEARASGGNVIAVGTTTTRALESAVDLHGLLSPFNKAVDLTIMPGYEFRITQHLLTNFHLPRSSLLLLVSAFAGRELVLDAYRHAVKAGYRFYSYGDCMLIL